MEEISNGIVKWGCRTREELDQRCEYLDAVFEDMKANGYRTQAELLKNDAYIRAPFRAHEEDHPIKIEDEITIRIGHDGVILFEDGRHRLAMARVLGIETIPVKISVRHSDWMQFRKEVIEYAKSQDGKLYAPITHIDLAHIPAYFGEERFELLMANLEMTSGSVLDIGSHWGYFCHRFEEAGFDCFAIENAAIHVHFLEKLKRAENRRFEIIHGDVFDLREKAEFDIVLALNIFHHFLKTQSSYEQLQQLLQRLDMKVMFFQAHCSSEPQMAKAYVNYDEEDFADFILQNSCLNRARLIGRGKDDRAIYKLERVKE
jgi:2-polyprenyl-3-methyl-5-hydroxy-6-metoxy-1,4-benzoquinol methylase